MKPSLAIMITASIFVLVGVVRALVGPAAVPARPFSGTPPARIVSLAPSITESLFALGLGDRVVGVTRYCEYPPEAQTRTIIGGFVDPNYEAIVSLKPDLAVVLVIHDEARARFAALNIPALAVDHRTIGGILDSFAEIARRCGVPDRGTALAAKCQARLDAVARKTDGLPRVRVLISSAREFGSGRIESVYAAGRGQWYDALLHAAGGENAYPNDGIAFPEISPEGILRIDPDVIIELAPKLDSGKYTEAQILAEWSTVPGLRAAREKHIYLLRGSHVAIPGPRFVDVLDDFARVLHPEVDWSAP